MNTRITSVLLVALIITGTCFTSQAFAASITVETDSDVYDHSSLITITGTVDPVDPNEVPVIIMVIAPNGNIAYVNQISLNSDGAFSAEISTAGNLMKDNGTYQIQVSYSAVDATTSVELTTTTATAATTGTVGTAETGESIIESAITSGQISYDITCGTVSQFWVNGEETDFIQNGNNLIIPCEAGTERIEIYGSWAIPEFGVIAAVILAVAIASIIAVSAKSRLTLVPRN